MSDKFEKIWSVMDTIPGWYRREEAELLAFELERLMSRDLSLDSRFVEVGSYAGRSAYLISYYVPCLWCIDLWPNPVVYQQFSSFLSGSGVVALCEWDTNVTRLDNVVFLHLDHDHSFDSVFRSLCHWRWYISPGAVVAVHDYHEGSAVKRVFDEFGVSPVRHAGSLAIFEWRYEHGGKNGDFVHS